MATLRLFHPSSSRDRNTEDLEFWLLQWTLAAALLAVGIAKFALTPIALHELMPWTLVVPVWFVRFIAIVEITGAVGLTVPAWLRIIPHATPWAACGVVGMQWLALAFHLSRGEWFMMPVNLMVGAAAALVAWGRFNYLPISALNPATPAHVREPGTIPPGMD